MKLTGALLLALLSCSGCTAVEGSDADDSPSPESGDNADETASNDTEEVSAHGAWRAFEDLGAHPVDDSAVTRGGTMTFTNVGAPGSWPRRLDREPGDPACDYKDGADTWGGHCCQQEFFTESDQLAPFDEEMTLILKAVRVKQLAIYQPNSPAEGASWSRITSWDARGTSENIWFTQEGQGGTEFPGDLTGNDCVGYLMQEASVDCDPREISCPNDPGVLHEGFSGSKLVIFLGNMDVQDTEVASCQGDGLGHPGPWVAFVASELVRDGARKWDGLCNCYSKTGSVGDGCGEINVFEVVMDENEFSNREFASTGVRSYQAGHVGGSVCGVDCERDAFLPSDIEVVDACGGVAYAEGPELEVGGPSAGCPVWRRPRGDRYFFILLDEARRMIQVGIIHPGKVPESLGGLLPSFPADIQRALVEALLDLRLPE